MKKLLIMMFGWISLAGFGQRMVSFPPLDTLDYFCVDTLRVSGDSSFVSVQHFHEGHLISKADQINVRVKGNSTNCNGDKGSDLCLVNTIFHGNVTGWYVSGKLKCSGTVTFNIANEDWKYWDESGKEILMPKKRESKSKRIRWGVDGYAVSYGTGKKIKR